MKLRKLGSSELSQRRGVAAVEFALVVPFFVILMFGMIEVGRGIMVHQLMTNAAREGAREAILEGATTSKVQKAVVEHLKSVGISGVIVTATPAPSTAKSRDPILVTVSVPISNVLWMASSKYFPANSNFQARSTMLKDAE